MPENNDKMDREEAIEFLEKEKKIKGYNVKQYCEDDEALIKQTMKMGGYIKSPPPPPPVRRGRVYGDPIVELNDQL